MNPKDWGKSMRAPQEPCEYCDEKSAGKLIFSTRRNVKLKVGKQTGVEYYDDVYGWQDEAFEFKFCPMCGRKLEVEDEQRDAADK